MEASEVAVYVRMIGGSAFQKEAEGNAAAIEGMGAAGRKAQADLDESIGSATLATKIGSLGSKAESAGSKLMNFGRTATLVGAPIAAVGYYAVKSANSFNESMMNLVTNATMPLKSLNSMSTAAENLAVKFGQTPQAVAQALYPIESIGARGPKAIQELTASLQGTVVGLDTLSSTSDAVTTMMASHIKGAGGPVEAMSLMDKAVSLGKMHLQDLTDSMKSGIVPMAKTFGMSIQQVLAMIAGLTRTGTPASSVAARMRLMLTSMVSPTAEGVKALSQMGLGQFQLAKDLSSPGGLMTALSDLKMHTEGMSKVNANDLIAEIFGKSRGMAQIANALGSLTNIQSIYAALGGTTPATLDTHTAEAESTSAFKFKQAKAALDRGMIQLGDQINKYILPMVAKLIPIISSVVDFFGGLPGPVKQMIVYFGALLVVLGPVSLVVGAFLKGIGMIMTGIETLSGAEGLGALRLGIASTTAEFIALAAPLAAAALTFELFTQKKGPFATARHAISHAGFKTGEFLVGDANQLGLLKGAGQRDRMIDYLQSSAFKKLSRVQQSDIEGLQYGKNTWQWQHLGQVMSDLKGVSLPNIPGLAQFSQAAKLHPMASNGLSNMSASWSGGSIHITVQSVLDSKVINTATTKVQRKQQNRR